MDSSRGGPLTTFIMILPLIVVPAIAMLRPAGQEGSLLSDLLSAASSSSQDDGQSTEPSAEQVSEDPLESLFADLPGQDAVPQRSADRTGAESSPFAEVSDDSLTEDALTEEALVRDFARDFSAAPPLSASVRTTPPAQGSPLDARTEQLLAELRQMGATRTLWFSPGHQSIGFVAFFPTGQGIVSYRFEAVASSQAAAVMEVMQQASAWQRSRGR
ncbi:MAG: hypothetical protein RIK87_29820 [Fuerstiella sp.]